MSNYKNLCKLLEEGIKCDEIKNKRLKRILLRAGEKSRDKFIFFRSNHRDESSPHRDETGSGSGYSIHYDWEGEHTDGYSELAHRDHKDHEDYNEISHSDTGYSESRHHTDSSGRHSDYSECEHTDKGAHDGKKHRDYQEGTNRSV